MWMRIAKIVLGLLLKYIIGLVFSVICFAAAIIVIGVLAVFVMGMSRCGSMGIVFGTALFVGIPIGAMLGIYLIDKFILGVAVLKRQLIAGFVVGVAASVSLVILHFYVVQILPHGHEGTSEWHGGFSIFYIVCVLIALLGYTIAGLMKRTTTKEANPPKEQESS
jgi:hypothetical protein